MNFGTEKDAIRQALDIVELVGAYLPLHRQGRNFVGLCPFHKDTKPSLQVNPERQIWKCWPCNKGGDIFSWVMEHDKVEFREAIRMAEAKVGLVRVQAVTAHPITASELTLLTERLKKVVGPGVMVTASTDPSLIAGLTLRFDDTMIDVSARRLLAEMKDTILTAPVGANLWSE